MNKTKIEWCDLTWNPVTGCKHGCPYCYARKIAERFRGSKAWPAGFSPMFHALRLDDLKTATKPQSIFVCSMADLFGEWVPDSWIEMIFAAIQSERRHTYLFLTKNPKRYHAIPKTYFSKNVWVGTSVTGIDDLNRIETMQELPDYIKTFVSFEPMLGKFDAIDLLGINQIIMGAQTKPGIRPEYDGVLTICEEADDLGANVFMKDSIAKWFPDRELRRELAWSVDKK